MMSWYFHHSVVLLVTGFSVTALLFCVDLSLLSLLLLLYLSCFMIITIVIDCYTIVCFCGYYGPMA